MTFVQLHLKSYKYVGFMIRKFSTKMPSCFIINSSYVRILSFHVLTYINNYMRMYQYMLNVNIMARSNKFELRMYYTYVYFVVF